MRQRHAQTTYLYEQKGNTKYDVDIQVPTNTECKITGGGRKWQKVLSNKIFSAASSFCFLRLNKTPLAEIRR